jgi:hypothetical protein
MHADLLLCTIWTAQASQAMMREFQRHSHGADFNICRENSPQITVIQWFRQCSCDTHAQGPLADQARDQKLSWAESERRPQYGFRKGT